MKRISITGLALMLPVFAMAHDGHGGFHGTAWHYLSSFWHVLPLALSVVAIVYFVRKWKTKKGKA